MSSKNKLQAFTLIELLVVITILAIISVVAYTSFSWSTDKAKNSKKLSDISSIETWLNMYFQDKTYYPMPSAYNASTNVWGYSNIPATPTATFTWAKNWDQIASVSWALIKWWWNVYLSWATGQIWAKWTIDSTVLWKTYLSQELSDPNLKDIKVWNDKTFKDYWIWEYIYWVYAKNNTNWSSTSQKWSAYNVAATLKDDQKWYVAKVIWNFDSSICLNCPDSLIWSWTVSVIDSAYTWSMSIDGANQLLPYPVDWF